MFLLKCKIETIRLTCILYEASLLLKSQLRPEEFMTIPETLRQISTWPKLIAADNAPCLNDISAKRFRTADKETLK